MGPGKVNGLIAQFLERIGVTVGGVVAGAVDPTVVSVTAGVGSPASMTTGKRYNNLGTTVKAGLVLPTNPVVGNHVWVTCVDSDGLRIAAPTGTTIQLGDVTCATAGYFETVRVGSAVHLVCTSATTWVADDTVGTWRPDSTTAPGFAYTPSPRTAFTPTGSWSANTTYSGFYWQVGKTLHMEVKVATSGAPTAASLSVNLPANYTTVADLSVGGNSFGIGGAAWVQDSGAAHVVAYPWVAAGATSVLILYQTNFTTGWNNVNATQPITWGAGDTLTINVAVPIQ